MMNPSLMSNVNFPSRSNQTLCQSYFACSSLSGLERHFKCIDQQLESYIFEESNGDINLTLVQMSRTNQTLSLLNNKYKHGSVSEQGMHTKCL